MESDVTYRTLGDPTVDGDISSLNDKSSRPMKKPYKELNLAEKVELIKMAEDNVGLSQATIAEKYSIAKSNVCRILQRKSEYLRAYQSSGFSGSRKRKLKLTKEDKEDTEIVVPIPRRPSISGNESLRAHMYKEHEVSRMFMCRCCNWAFPDKTTLHLHIQSKEDNKKSSSLPSTSLTTGLPSAFVPLQSTINNAFPGALPFLSSQSIRPSSTVLPDDIVYRIHERILLNQLFTNHNSLNSFSFLPHSSPTNTEEKSPSSNDAVKGEEDEDTEEIEVRVDDDEPPTKKIHMDEEKTTVSRTSSLSEKRVESVFGSSSSGCSPSQMDRLSSSPIDRKENTFHTLNVDPSSISSFVGLPHVSPSETHSTASPQGDSSHPCFNCNLLRTKCISQEGKISYLENQNASLQSELSKSLSSSRQTESLALSLRTALLECQEEALRFARSESVNDSQAVMRFLNHILQSTLIR